MEETTSRTGCRWQTGLLWRDMNVDLPPSYIQAQFRLSMLEKKLDKDPALNLKYNSIIEDYISKGYLRKAEDRTPRQRHWYLPHFPVTNPMKPEKVRIVFDAASKANKMSLNDALVSGPDLLKPLPHILFGFRKARIGFIGDIKEMFHRVKIDEIYRVSVFYAEGIIKIYNR